MRMMDQSVTLDCKKMFLGVALFLFILLASNVRAQVTSGTISGTVTDSAGAQVPGAKITVKNPATGIVSTTVSGSSGVYALPNLPIGDYEVRVEQTGFSTDVRNGINLTVGREAVVDFILRIGQTSEQVVVKSDAPLVETSDSSVGALIGAKQVRDLPLNGRNLQQLILLAPGVSQVNADAAPGTYTHGNASTFTAAGLRPVGMMELLDGAIVSNFYREGAGNLTGNTSMGVEAVAEFQTLTNTYSAEFGGQGAVVNESSRSGTNSLHGSLYGFYRDSVVNAANYRFPGQTTFKPSFHKTQFGGSVGGPIKKDKTFFFANYEGLRATIGLVGAGFVPDANARLGLVPCALSPTTACNASGLTSVTVNSAVATILPLYGAPGVEVLSASGAATGTARYTGNASTTQNEDFVTGRIDQHISDRDNFFISYVFDNANTVAGSVPIPAFGSAEFGRNQYFTAQENHTFSPRLFNVADAHLVRLVQNIAPQSTGATYPALNFFGANYGAGQVNVTSLSNLGGGTILSSAQTRETLSDHMYYTVGRHSLKAGVDVTRLLANVVEPLQAGGVFTFPSLVSFLQGSPSAVIGRVPGSGSASRNFRQIEVQPFIADDYRIRSNFTLNLGLRYGFSTNIIDGSNQLYALINPLTATGYTQVSHAFASNPSLFNIDPRVGFAYSPFSGRKTSVRGGFGMFHDVFEGRDVLGYVFGYPFVSTTLNNYNGPGTGTTPIPFPGINPVALGKPAVNLTPLYSNIHTGYAMEYNLNVQQEVAPHTVFNIGYEGSSGVHLATSYNINANTTDGTLNGRPYRPANDPNVHLLNPNAGTLNFESFNGTSSYHSLQTSIRSEGHTLQTLFSYTFARCMDVQSEPYSGDANTLGESSSGIFDALNIRSSSHGRCDYSVSHNFNANAIYTTPFRGNALIEGYQLGVIALARSGLPFTPLISSARSNTDSSTASPPDKVLGVSPNIGRTYASTGLQWFNPAAFTPQPYGVVGNAGRDSLIGPNYVDFDVNFVKTTPLHFISDSASVQLRWDLFNIMNHPNFGLPNGTVFSGSAVAPALSSTAGLLTTTVGNMRQMQFGLKLLF